MNRTTLILSLYEIGVFQFGDFTLKSGIHSPIYIDLRLISSYPDILKHVGALYVENLKTMQFDRIAGVPYAAIPLATAVSLSGNFPMIYTRKEAKDHGLKKMVEGVFHPGEKVVVIEDLVTRGVSILETVNYLKEAGLTVVGMAIFLDRQQGGVEQLEKQGYVVKSAITLSEVLDILKNNGKISEEQFKNVHEYLKNSQ